MQPDNELENVQCSGRLLSNAATLVNGCHDIWQTFEYLFVERRLFKHSPFLSSYLKFQEIRKDLDTEEMRSFEKSERVSGEKQEFPNDSHGETVKNPAASRFKDRCKWL